MIHIQNVAYKNYIKLYIWNIYIYIIEYNSICTYLCKVPFLAIVSRSLFLLGLCINIYIA